NDDFLERLRKVEEAEMANAVQAARLANMERSLRGLEENMQRSMRDQQELRESVERSAASQDLQHQHLLHRPHSSEIFQNPFATNEPLIRDYNPGHAQDSRQPSFNTTGINPRTADAILRHNLSSNHHENVNPFADPSALLESDSSSSLHGDNDGDAFADADDRSMTIGHDDEHDWTEAEIGSVGSHDSDDSWV
ncbi:hypothetical protein BGZ65_001885, partial [Modicella reniformis]